MEAAHRFERAAHVSKRRCCGLCRRRVYAKSSRSGTDARVHRVAKASRHKMLSFLNTHTEYFWTKRDLAARLGVDGDPRVMATTQLAAGFFVLLPTRRNIALMREWLSLATEDGYRHSDDSPSQLPNDRRFKEHRHDASIGSLLRKIHGTEVSHYEVQPYDQAYRTPTVPPSRCAPRVFANRSESLHRGLLF